MRSSSVSVRDKPILSAKRLSARSDKYLVYVVGIVPATTIELVISLVVHLDGVQAATQERGLCQAVRGIRGLLSKHEEAATPAREAMMLDEILHCVPPTSSTLLALHI